MFVVLTPLILILRLLRLSLFMFVVEPSVTVLLRLEWPLVFTSLAATRLASLVADPFLQAGGRDIIVRGR